MLRSHQPLRRWVAARARRGRTLEIGFGSGHHEKFVLGRKSDRIGLVSFAGEALTQVPLTVDYPVVTAAVNGLQSGQLEDGTAIGTAHPVSLAVDSFGTEHVDPGRIVDVVWEAFDFRPAAIIERLQLLRRFLELLVERFCVLAADLRVHDARALHVEDACLEHAGFPAHAASKTDLRRRLRGVDHG